MDVLLIIIVIVMAIIIFLVSFYLLTIYCHSNKFLLYSLGKRNRYISRIKNNNCYWTWISLESITFDSSWCIEYDRECRFKHGITLLNSIRINFCLCHFNCTIYNILLLIWWIGYICIQNRMVNFCLIYCWFDLLSSSFYKLYLAIKILIFIWW